MKQVRKKISYVSYQIRFNIDKQLDKKVHFELENQICNDLIWSYMYSVKSLLIHAVSDSNHNG